MNVTLNNQYDLTCDSGFFIARDINGPVLIWDTLLDAHQDLKQLGVDGTKIIFIAEKLLTE